MPTISNKNILITGATGFIGKYIVEHAIANNYRVYITVRKTSNTSRLSHLQFTPIVVDFTSEATIKLSLPEDLIFDTVIHNAGVTSCFVNEDYYTYNYKLTKDFCAALKHNNLLKGKFIFTSSLAALGPGDEKVFDDITETKIPNPISTYGKSKLQAEKEVINSGLNYVIIRPTAVFGEGTLDYKDLKTIVKKGLAIYTASPNQHLSFIHANDIANAIFLANNHNASVQIYNLSDGIDYTLASVYNTVALALNKQLKLKFRIPKFIVFGVAGFNGILEKLFKTKNALNSIEKAKEITALNWKCSAKKIKKELGFTPSHTLNEIID